MDMDAQGRVFMKFTVEKDGSITNITVETNRTGCDEFVK
jgi:outer membrane biosynthesis protein TonB